MNQQDLVPQYGSLASTQDLKFIKQDVELVCTEERPVGYFNLIAAANSHNLLCIAFANDKTIKALSYDTVFGYKGQIKLSNQFQFVYNLSFTPTALSIPQNGSSSILLIIGEKNLEFFDINTRTSISKLELPDCGEIIDQAWHPIYQTSIVALTTKLGFLLVVGLNANEKNANIVYKEQKFAATTCCWSPKGKNLAIGTSQGTIIRLELVIDATNKSLAFKVLENEIIRIQKGPITPEHMTVKLHWITNKYIVCLHAKLKGEYSDSMYSLVPIKPNEPILCWPGVPAERCDPNYSAHILNLSNVVICLSSFSTEAVILGVLPGGKITESKDWKSISVEDDNSKLELLLDDNNEETYPRGITVVKTNTQLALVMYTSSGVLYPYMVNSADPSLQPPMLQKFVDCPINIPRPIQQTSVFSSMMKPSVFQTSMQSPFQTSSLAQSLQPTQHQTFQSSQPSTFQLSQPTFQLSQTSLQSQPISLVNKPQLSIQSQPPPQQQQQQQQQQQHQHQQQQQQQKPQQQLATQAPSATAAPSQAPVPSKLAQSLTTQTKPPAPKSIQLPDLNKNIQELKKKIEFCDMFLTLLEDLNHIRDQLEEVQEIHKVHVEVLEAIKKDIDSLDLGMLENLYLVEYIRSRIKGAAIKKSLDPLTSKKMENMRQNLRIISEKLRDLDINVDVAWEDFVRSKASSGKKQQRSPFNSIEIIYKTMATNQKIIDILKGKVKMAPRKTDKKLEADAGANFDSSVLLRREMNSSHMIAFERFLASRSQVPVRRPVK